jgi:two-component system response regulator EvgA
MDVLNLVHIEDCPLWRGAVRGMVAHWDRVKYLGGADSAAEGLRLCQELRPELVVLDLFLPDADGVQLLQAFFALSAPPKILLLSCRADEWTLHNAWTTQVAGMIWKTCDVPRQLKEAMAALADGKRYFSKEVLAAMSTARSRPDAFQKIFSQRELMLVSLFAAGASDADIAVAEGSSRSTIHSHRQRIMKKLNIHRTLDLSVWAKDKGIGGGRAAGGRNFTEWFKHSFASK